MSQDYTSQIDFLNSAISDCQELIRFIDTKTAVIITVIGGYSITFFTQIENIIKHFNTYTWGFWINIFCFITLLLLCVLVTQRIIKPTHSPNENIDVGEHNAPTLKYYLASNDYSKAKFYGYKNSPKFKLKENYTEYNKLLASCSQKEILSSLSYELFKVSYIRNVKNDRFHYLTSLLFVTTISFFSTYLIYIFETNKAIELLK